MKKIKLYSIAFALLFAVSSCTLTSYEFGQVNSSVFPSTERNMLDLVTANAYGAFRNDGYSGAFNAATGFHLLADMATDFGMCSWGEGDWGPLVYANFQNNEGARNPRRTWSDFLHWISRMEMTLYRISDMEGVNEDLKRRSIAELELAQGWLAFLLWDFYGGLVIADLETLKSPQDVVILPRKSSDETIQYIETKLRSAINSGALAKSYTIGNADYGRFTQGLAQMILLKLYMQTHQWSKAIEAGRELMKPEYGYALVTNPGNAGTAYANIFSAANEGNRETIWAVRSLQQFQGNIWYDHVISWGGYKMTWNFYQLFAADDQRNGPEVVWMNPAGQEASETDGVLPVKYDMQNRVGGTSYTDWIVYRYADAITLLAEAIVKQGNTITPEAINLLNQVRTRAGLTAYTATNFTGVDDFVNKLLWERAFEFWYEGTRRQDLIRNNKYVEVMAAKALSFNRVDNITRLGQNAHRFPLPDSAINEFNKGGFENQQNPGYN
ncbi:MAG: RagB/SusD family nutrient uptake outer membrane protein [Dysgonamonadaceae bacterium]|jgi:hypothetical protein|nr:RagB/SusD family nutrient uptake outer membrane protein [Dysgonamonadaceae bacterium]